MPKLSYLAGIIDGEGCFNIGKCRTSYVPRILVVNTEKKIVDWLERNFGGDITKTSVKGRVNWKPRYSWRLSHKKALLLTENILPYLIIKEAQGLIFKAFSLAQSFYSRDKRGIVYEYFKQELHKLNKKGTRNAIA